MSSCREGGGATGRSEEIGFEDARKCNVLLGAHLVAAIEKLSIATKVAAARTMIMSLNHVRLGDSRDFYEYV